MPKNSTGKSNIQSTGARVISRTGKRIIGKNYDASYEVDKSNKVGQPSAKPTNNMHSYKQASSLLSGAAK